MEFDQFLVWQSIGVGILLALTLDFFLYRRRAGSEYVAVSKEEDSLLIAKLQTELKAQQEQLEKVGDIHAYTRQLETKLQAMEAAVSEPQADGSDAIVRVKVLEQKLAEKSDLEAKLAIAMQQLADYKAKAEMFDTVASAQAVPMTLTVETPLEQVAAQIPSPPTPKVSPEVMVQRESRPEVPTNLDPVVALMNQAQEISLPVTPVMETIESAPIQLTTSASKPKPIAGKNGNVSTASKLHELVEDTPTLLVEVEGNNVPLNTVSSFVAPTAADYLRDPLEKIEGIGPVYQQKLYEAGIKTFAQLAASSPGRITEIIEPQSWQTVDVMKWRREAALYASGEKE